MPLHKGSPKRILLDHSIITNASRLRPVKRDPPPTAMFSNSEAGVMRIPADKSAARERQLQSIYTVGRLVREGQVIGCTSTELWVESLKDYFQKPPAYAFAGCEIERVPAPVERGRFIQVDLEEFVKKGGAKGGTPDSSGTSQISFFNWLLSLTPQGVERVIQFREARKLTDFDCESLKDLDWLGAMLKRSQSEKHLPDLFHLWTARRNDIEIFLTLDEKLSNIVRSIEKEKSAFKVGVTVLTPVEFLETMGVTELDPFVCEYDRFYWYHEIGAMFPSHRD